MSWSSISLPIPDPLRMPPLPITAQVKHGCLRSGVKSKIDSLVENRSNSPLSSEIKEKCVSKHKLTKLLNIQNVTEQI